MDTAAEKVFRCKLENVVGKPLQTILPNVNLPKEATHVSIFNFRTTQHESLQFLQKTFKNTFSMWRCNIIRLWPHYRVRVDKSYKYSTVFV